MNNNRWLNAGMWTSTVTNLSGVLLMVGLAPERARVIVAVAGLVIGFLNQVGILSNPKEGFGYLDTKDTNVNKDTKEGE